MSGLTASHDFPTVTPIQSAYAGGMYDIVVMRFVATR
jgi:hypothetical protein